MATAGGAASAGSTSSIALEQALNRTTDDMLSCLTGCERIRRTPLPPGYVGVLRAVILIWLMMLPICLLDEMPFSNIPIVALTSYLLLSIEDIAIQMEDPFGFDSNDLPLEAFCLTVQADVIRLLDELQPRQSPEPQALPQPQQARPHQSYAPASIRGTMVSTMATTTEPPAEPLAGRETRVGEEAANPMAGEKGQPHGPYM